MKHLLKLTFFLFLICLADSAICADSDIEIIKKRVVEILMNPNVDPSCQQNEAVCAAVASGNCEVVELLLNNKKITFSDPSDKRYQHTLSIAFKTAIRTRI